MFGKVDFLEMRFFLLVLRILDLEVIIKIKSFKYVLNVKCCISGLGN